MTVYIAAPFKRKEEARRAREILESLGIGCTSRWLDTHLSDYDSPPDVLQREALEDFHDVHRAEGLVLLDGFPGEGRGMFVELGYALAKGKPIWVLEGVQNCIFYHHPRVRRIESLSEIKEAA